MKHFFFIICFLFNYSKFLSQSFYDVNTIQKIEITFAQANWDYQMDTAKAGKDGYVEASLVKVNGVTFTNVGVKYKGNSSYSPASNKNPLHIELNTFKEQSYQGYTDIKLGNNYQDPSMIREVLSYDILKNYMHCPLSNFAKVYINGAYYGVYSNTESVNKKFYSEHFYSSDYTAIKCNPVVTPGSATKCNLKYTSNDSSAYFNFYEIKSDAGWNDLVRLCDTITNFSGSIENNIDIDRAIWMLAFNSALVNLDSYSGAFCQNYYLYKDNTKKFNPVIWDLNMCFGGFPFVGSGTVSLGSQSISGLQQLSLNIHSTDVHWPLINKIIANSTYKRMYAAHVKTIINEMIATGTYTTKAAQFQALIDTSVISDPYKLFTYAQFQNGLTANTSVGSYSVPGISVLMTARNAYLQAQTEFTAAAPTVTNIAASTSTLNTQVTITANITNASVSYLSYRLINSEKFIKVQMYDDGLHQDGAAGDNIFGASFTLNGNQAQYYIYSENSNAGIFSPARAEHEFYEIKKLPNPQPGEIVINEFLADNEGDVRNEFHLLEDWIELYNNTNKTLSLSNYYLSNESDSRAKYAFPHTTVMQPYSYLIVWADKITLPGTQLHATFKLEKDGDHIILSNGISQIIDSCTYGDQSKDVSMGRCPDGTGSFSFRKYPTYASANCIVGLEEEDLFAGSLQVFPNPAQNYFTIQSATGETQIVEVSNITGQVLYHEKFNGNITLSTIAWPDGLYFVKCNQSVKKIIINH